MGHLKTLSSASTRPMVYLSVLGLNGMNAWIILFGKIPATDCAAVVTILFAFSATQLFFSYRYYVEVAFDAASGELHIKRLFGQNSLVIPREQIVSLQKWGISFSRTIRLRYNWPGKKSGVFFFTLKWGADDLLRQVTG